MHDLSGRDYEVGHCRDCGAQLRTAPHLGEVWAVEYREDGLRLLCRRCFEARWPPLDPKAGLPQPAVAPSPA